MRNLRRWVTARASEAWLAAAPLLPRRAVDAMESAMGRAGPYLPVLARYVADNMRSAGVYSPEAHREYFRRVAAHLAGGMQIFRYSRHLPPPGGPMPAGLARIVHERIELDDSVECLRRAAEPGRGVVIIGAHIANYLLLLARLNEEIPLTVYLRHSRHARRREAKERWCRATGIQYIAEPASAADPTRRAATLAEALGERRVLVITPDLPQKNGAGTPVRFFDRHITLPNGAAALSLLTGAPLVAAIARPIDRRTTCLVLRGPLTADVSQRGRGWRQAAMTERMQWFADHLASFLREFPALWFLWGDRRWTQVFRGDARFVDFSQSAAAPDADAMPGDTVETF